MNEFECIGYMKNKLPGEGEFSMFVNENSYGSTGGFSWTFQDYCPELPHEYGRVFVHLISINELRRTIINELEHSHFMAVQAREDKLSMEGE